MKVLLLFISMFFLMSTNSIQTKDIVFKRHIPIDTIKPGVNFIPVSRMIQVLVDSVKISVKKGECPEFLYDECLDYRKIYSLYSVYVWDTINKVKKLELCSHCVKEFSSLKKDLIDSLDTPTLKQIVQLADTSKLNLKCNSVMSKYDYPQTCSMFSTLDLIRLRLKY